MGVSTSQGAFDGILIGWNDRHFTYLDTYVEQFSLSLKFRSNLDSFDWWLTGVYGPIPQILSLCSLMSSISFSAHWVTIG